MNIAIFPFLINLCLKQNEKVDYPCFAHFSPNESLTQDYKLTNV